MEEDKTIKCPICNSEKWENLLNLNCGNLDSSTLYQIVKINACLECGHIYNGLSSFEIDNLMKYYNEEYGPTNIGSTDKTGDRPGSCNKNTFRRYDQIYNLVSKYIKNNCRVLDVGCAMGGFLDYLHQKGLTNLSGVDPIAKYVSCVKEKNNFDIKIGTAESIPYGNKTFDLLVMDQVIEHLIDPIDAFKEAKRVLADGGLLCLGVPDAMRYNKNYFFDFYWFLMREHIQHFDIEHLKLIASKEGFELIDFSESDTPMNSEKMILPNLNIIFRRTDKKIDFNINRNCFELKKEIKKYTINNLEKLNSKRKIINDLVVSQKPLYIWGIGREFLYLYEAAGLKNCNIVGLIDSNPYKRDNFLLNGKKIIDMKILKELNSNFLVIITAIAHSEIIKKTLEGFNYSGDVLTFE